MSKKLSVELLLLAGVLIYAFILIAVPYFEKTLICPTSLGPGNPVVEIPGSLNVELPPARTSAVELFRGATDMLVYLPGIVIGAMIIRVITYKKGVKGNG